MGRVRWLAVVTLLLIVVQGAGRNAAWAASPPGPVGPEARALILQAGNSEDERQRQATLETLASLPSADQRLRHEARRMAAFVQQWNTGSLKFYGKDWARYDFGLADDSPLAPLAALYQGRMLAWTLIENSTLRSSPTEGPRVHREACAAFLAAQRAFPENRIPGMYLGQPIPWPSPAATPPPGAPEWAVLQAEQLDRLREIILWWIAHRQRPDGQFGGGWGDDCEMWRWWAAVLLGFDDPRIVRSQVLFSRAALERSNVRNGFHNVVTDVEHAAEGTTDNLVPLLLLEPDEPRWQRWAARLVDFQRDVWTGVNQRGRRQFKSFYFSGTEVSTAPTRALDVIANVGALHPALLVWQHSGDPRLGAAMTAWLDTWVEATARAENGKPAGILPAAIRWPGGEVSGAKAAWWEPVAPGGFMHSYYIWPSVITEMTDALLIAHLQTGEAKYLAPIRSMAEIRLRHLRNPPARPSAPGSEAWCAAQLGPRPSANSNFGALVKTLARCRALLGTAEFDELLQREGGEFVVADDARSRQQMVEALRDSAAALRVNFPGFTSEVRSTDRVMRFAQFLARDYKFDDYLGVTLPKHELLYRMVTGDTNAPRFPQPAVRWFTVPQQIAALVTKATRQEFAAELYHFGSQPRPMSAELRLLAAGRYAVAVTTEDGTTVGRPAELTVAGPRARVEFQLPPRRLCRLKVVPVAARSGDSQPPRRWVEIVAHRGASHDAPENTLAAFRLGWQQGADANELDVRLTRDGRLIVIHDATTKRTAGLDKPVADMTVEELRTLDAGRWKGAAWAGQRLPTLDEVLGMVPAGKRLFVEIKGGPQAVPELRRVLAESRLPADRVAVIGFEYATVEAVKRQLPDFRVYWVVSPEKKKGVEPPSLDALIAQAKAARLDGLDLRHDFPIDADFVRQIKAAALELYVWTVDDAAIARRLAAAGVDGITTNRPGWLRQQLEQAE